MSGWADRKTARDIRAERPQVSGVVKAVDARKNTLAVEDNGAPKTFTVTGDARVEIDGKPGKLADVPPGARVTLGRVDLATVDRIQAALAPAVGRSEPCSPQHVWTGSRAGPTRCRSCSRPATRSGRPTCRARTT